MEDENNNGVDNIRSGVADHLRTLKGGYNIGKQHYTWSLKGQIHLLICSFLVLQL
jgi:hypothetical protein